MIIEKNNDLLELSRITGIEANNLSEHIYKKLEKNKILLDFADECNNSVSNILDLNKGYSLKEFAHKVFKPSVLYSFCKATNLLGKLILKGDSGDCPDCGCEFDLDWDEGGRIRIEKCINHNCNYEVSYEENKQ